MHTKTLPPSTRSLFKLLTKKPEVIQAFYLTGGTALSLHLGHRESEDLDFFSKEPFDPQQLQQQLSKLGKLTNVEIAQGTLNCFLRKVKLQFLHYPYNLLQKPLYWNGIAVSSLLDIACTKLLTISLRGDKKDFIDLFVLLKRYSLAELFDRLDEKYAGIDFSKVSILKALVYFDDAEEQPMPRMHTDLTWEEVKTGIIKQVKDFKL